LKVRTGFVSNSSSQSFLVQVSAYGSVFSLALEMLHIRNADWSDGNMPRDRLAAEAKSIRASKRDPNTSVAFQCTNYDTYIVKCGDVYAVSTCNNHAFCDRLDGLIYREITPALAALLGYDKKDIGDIHLDELMGDVEFDLPYACFYWWPIIDRVVKKITSEAKDIMESKECCNRHQIPERKVEVEMHDGSRKVVCPKCALGVSLW
jgi:hypothetical protein